MVFPQTNYFCIQESEEVLFKREPEPQTQAESNKTFQRVGNQ